MPGPEHQVNSVDSPPTYPAQSQTFALVMPGLGMRVNSVQSHGYDFSRAFETFVTYGRSSSLFLGPEAGQQTASMAMLRQQFVTHRQIWLQPPANNVCPAVYLYGVTNCRRQCCLSLSQALIQQSGVKQRELILVKVTGFKSQSIVHELRDQQPISGYLRIFLFIYRVRLTIRNAQFAFQNLRSLKSLFWGEKQEKKKSKNVKAVSKKTKTTCSFPKGSVRINISATQPWETL